MFKKIFSAAVQLPNVILLIVSIFASLFLNWAIVIGLLGIIYLTLRNVSSEQFLKDFNKEETFKSIKQLSYRCEKLAEGPKNSTNTEKRTRVREILRVKVDIMSSLYIDKHSSLKQRIASQALELIVEYLHLIESYYLRLGNIDDNNLEQLEDRITKNREKVIVLMDNKEKSELEETLDIDERLFLKLKVEKEELNKINLKLNYIESSINLFKQNIKDDIDLDNSNDNVDEIINEAVALDNVISQKNRGKNKA